MEQKNHENNTNNQVEEEEIVQLEQPQQQQGVLRKEGDKSSLVLLTGYLGSGKTTLISHILKEQKQYKVAVIQNEFADEMGIEAPLMQDSEGKPFDKFYELPNGCICCTAKDDLLVAIEYLITNEKYKLDFILVETNGLADPSSTIQIFWVDDNIESPAELKSIHTVVPVHRFEELKNNEVFIRQLIFADTILVNQIDRMKEEQIVEVEQKLRELNPLAKLKRTEFCNIDLNEIFDIDGFTLRKEKFDFVKQLENLDLDKHVHANENIKCHFIKFKKQFEFKDIEMKIGTLVWESEDKYKIHRMKGVVDIKDESNMFALQGVEDIFEVKKSNVEWENQEDRENKLLFICEGIEKQALIDLLTEN